MRTARTNGGRVGMVRDEVRFQCTQSTCWVAAGDEDPEEFASDLVGHSTLSDMTTKANR